MASEPPRRPGPDGGSGGEGDAHRASRMSALALFLLLTAVLVYRGMESPDSLLRPSSLLLGAGALTAIGGLLLRKEHHRWIATAMAGGLVMIWVLWNALAGP